MAGRSFIFSAATSTTIPKMPVNRSPSNKNYDWRLLRSRIRPQRKHFMVWRISENRRGPALGSSAQVLTGSFNPGKSKTGFLKTQGRGFYPATLFYSSIFNNFLLQRQVKNSDIFEVDNTILVKVAKVIIQVEKTGVGRV